MLYLGQQNRQIFACHMTDFCWAILSADKISQFYRSPDIPLSPSIDQEQCQALGKAKSVCSSCHGMQ